MSIKANYVMSKFQDNRTTMKFVIVFLFLFGAVVMAGNFLFSSIPFVLLISSTLSTSLVFTL